MLQQRTRLQQFRIVRRQKQEEILPAILLARVNKHQSECTENGKAYYDKSYKSDKYEEIHKDKNQEEDPLYEDINEEEF